MVTSGWRIPHRQVRRWSPAVFTCIYEGTSVFWLYLDFCTSWVNIMIFAVLKVSLKSRFSLSYKLRSFDVDFCRFLSLVFGNVMQSPWLDFRYKRTYGENNGGVFPKEKKVGRSRGPCIRTTYLRANVRLPETL